MTKMRLLFIVGAAFVIVGAAFAQLGLGPSSGNAAAEKAKVKILSLEDVKKWNLRMTRKDVHELVSREAVIFATSFRVLFKAKEGGAYSVSFLPEDGKGPYKLAGVYYLPKYPEESPSQMILKGEPLPNLPVKRNK